MIDLTKLPEEVFLFLDDEREVHWIMTWEENPGKWIVARTSQEALAIIETGRVVEISFDNDLGLASYQEGWQVMKQMVDWIMEGKIQKPRYIGIHTANVVAAKRMQGYLRDLHRYKEAV